MVISRRALVATGGGAAAGLAATALGGCAMRQGEQRGVHAPPSASPKATIASGPNPFDALYEEDFALSGLSADQVPPVAAPARPADLEGAVVDPVYGTRLYRATSAQDGDGGRMRHEYSRRQAFNADCSFYLAQDGAGAWHLYDGRSFAHVAVLDRLVGDCEPLWHATDPALILFTSRNGGALWWTLDVTSGTTEVLVDVAALSPWPEATSYWTKGEGTTSADGRYLTCMATTYDEDSQDTTAHGLIMVDLVDSKAVGTLAAEDFPVAGAVPDHVSTSASGTWAVASWLEGLGGTVAFSRDFTDRRKLSTGSEHSDLVLGRDGEDYLVWADYGSGRLLATNLGSGNSLELHSLYPASGEAYALHVCGQAFDRPGWVVISTYGDSADYGRTVPAPRLRAEYRKVWLVEVADGGRAFNIAHTRPTGGDDDYFAEPQASASRDLSRIIFASDMAGSGVESYIVGLPSWVID